MNENKIIQFQGRVIKSLYDRIAMLEALLALDAANDMAERVNDEVEFQNIIKDIKGDING